MHRKPPPLTDKYSDVIGNDVFGHRTMKVSHPVRSAVNKHRIAWLVLQWVTMWESQVLNSTSNFWFFPFLELFLCLFWGGVLMLLRYW